jgi:Ca2+/Na+ antiporter
MAIDDDETGSLVQAEHGSATRGGSTETTNDAALSNGTVAVVVDNKKPAPLVKQKSFVIHEKERRAEAAKRLAEKRKAAKLATTTPKHKDIKGNGPANGNGSTTAIIEEDEEEDSPILMDDTVVDVDELDARSSIVRLIATLARPLEIIFARTIPSCEVGHDNESRYPLTFTLSFIWVALFSFIISVVVERWVAVSGVSLSLLGLALVAIGAEIPDTVQSVTAARKGYGSMAVANSSGSQITNILVGLGVPWLIANLMRPNSPVTIPDHGNIGTAAIFQACNLCLYASLLLGHAVITKSPKAVLTPRKGKIFLLAYVISLSGYAWVASSSSSSASTR